MKTLSSTPEWGDLDITERQLANGYYELSAMSYDMGEWYREHKVYDHKPTTEDYKRFFVATEYNK